MTARTTALELPRTPLKPGITLVEASAGTGKTYCVTGLVLRLLLEGRVEGPGRLLVMTFTNAATAELVVRMRERLRSAIRAFEDAAAATDPLLTTLVACHGPEGAQLLRRALRDFDDLEISTIHGFCRRVLDQHAFETGTPFDVEYVEDTAFLVKRASEDFWRRTLYGAGPLVAAVAVHESWSPDRLQQAYESCNGHRDIVMDPPASTVDAAIARLAAAADRIAEIYDRDELATTLASLDFTKSNKLDADEIEGRLRVLEAFFVAPTHDGLKAVVEMRTALLARGLSKRSKEPFTGFPLSKACDAFAAAVNDLEDALTAAFLAQADALMAAEKQRGGTAGFDDLLHRLQDAVNDPTRRARLVETTGRRFQAVLIDEFQDTDRSQYQIFRTLFGQGYLFFIGDPKQAIYGFRGADVFAYIDAKEDAAERRFTLESNWRSEPALVDAVTALFRNRTNPFGYPEIPLLDVTAAERSDRPTIAGDDRAALQWIWTGKHSSKSLGAGAACAVTVAEITALLASDAGVTIGGRRLEPRSIAVLVRTNRQAAEVQAALREAGVPAVVSRSGNVFESEEAAELELLLLTILSPRDARALRAALATRAWGWSAHRIAALGDDDEAWSRIVDELERLHALWLREGFVAMARELLELTEARQRLVAMSGGERRLTNFLHLVELAGDAAAAEHLSPDALVAWLAAARAAPADHQNDASELRLESDAEAVQIVTIHKSKGLEYDVVFCPFWDEATPKAKHALVRLRDGTAVYARAKPMRGDLEAHHERERESEQARLAYVALTRAKHRCYVVWGAIGEAPANSAIARLLHAAGGPQTEDASDWLADLTELCRRNPACMAVCDSAEVLARLRLYPRPASAAGAPCRARELDMGARARLEPWRVASFSSLSSHAPVAAADGELPDHGDPAEAGEDAETAPGGLAGFARGSRAGTCLHEILERCDFSAIADVATERLTADILLKHGLDRRSAHVAVADPTETVLHMLGQLTDCELPDTNFKLAAIRREQRLNEWRFFLPMMRLSRRSLAHCFAREGRGHVSDPYATLLGELGSAAVHGFLTGFVDLVFEHEQRWYVVDWKSNHLGDEAGAYDAAALQRSMREQHYVLQYHLYVLALDRYLRQRLVGYDYERHFGGVYYAYLRGIRPGSRAGWYVDRPPRALILALDTLLREGDAP